MKKNILILGGDGYLGWTLGLAFANRTNSDVILADNLIKRSWEKEAGSKPLVPQLSPKKKIAEYKRLFKKTNLSFERADMLDYDAIVRLIKSYKPSVIINAAQQPSAPFSMSSARNSAITFENNVVGNLNVLWAIAEVNPEIKYIKLGSAGCYCGVDTNFIPLNKIDFRFECKGKMRQIKNSRFPMYATDFYHQSKITDFLSEELASEVWNLKIVTIQQSTIFGATIPENQNQKFHKLAPRFNYDAVFGTVINRFVCQSVLGGPLTVYGHGDQETGLISLSDTVDNIIRISKKDLKPGQHEVVHNYTMRISVNKITEMLGNITGNIPVAHIENPRKEAVGTLKKETETHRAVKRSHEYKNLKAQKELENLIEFASHYKKNIDASIILPKIYWKKMALANKPNRNETKKDILQLRHSWSVK